MPTPDLIPSQPSLGAKGAASSVHAPSKRSAVTRTSSLSSSSQLMEMDDSSLVEPNSGLDADAESTTGTESVRPSYSSSIAVHRPGGEDSWSLAPSIPRDMTYDEQQRIFVIAPPPPRAPRLPPPTASGPTRKQTGPAKALPVHHTDSAPSMSSLANIPGQCATPVAPSSVDASQWVPNPSPGWKNSLHPKPSHTRLTSAEQRSLLASNEYHIPSRLGTGAGPELSVHSLAGTLPGVSSSVSLVPGVAGIRRRGSAPGGPNTVPAQPPRPTSASAWGPMYTNVNPPLHGAGAKVAELGAKLHILSRHPKSSGHDDSAPRAGFDPDNGYVIISSPSGGQLVDTRSILSQERKQQAQVHLVPPLRRASAPPAGGPSDEDLVEDLADYDGPGSRRPSWSSRPVQPTAAEQLLAAYRAGQPLPSDSTHSVVPPAPMSDTARAAAAAVAAHAQLDDSDGPGLTSVFEDSDSVVSDALTDVVGASSVHGQAFGFCAPNGAWRQSLLAGLCKPAPPSQTPPAPPRSRLGMRPRPASALGINSDRKTEKPKLSNLVGLRKPRTKLPPPSASAAAAAAAVISTPSASMFAAATGNVAPSPTQTTDERKISRRRSYSAGILDAVRRPGSASGMRSASGSTGQGQQSDEMPARPPSRSASRLSSKVASFVGSRRVSQAASHTPSLQPSQPASTASHLSPSAASQRAPSVNSGPVPSAASVMRETVPSSSDCMPHEDGQHITTPAEGPRNLLRNPAEAQNVTAQRPMSLSSMVPLSDPRHLSSVSGLLPPPPPSPAHPDSPTVPAAMGMAPSSGYGLEASRAATPTPLSPVPSSRYGNQGTAEPTVAGDGSAVEPTPSASSDLRPRSHNLSYPDAPFGPTNITNASSLVPPPDTLQGLAPRPRKSTNAGVSQMNSSQEGTAPSRSVSASESAPSAEQASANSADRPRSTRASIGSARAAVVAATLASEVASLTESVSSRDGPRSSPTRGTDERDQVEELTPAALRLLEEVSLKDRRSSLASSLASAAVARPASQASDGSSSAWSYALRMRTSHEPLSASAVSSHDRTSSDSRRSLPGTQSRPRSRALALTAPQASFGRSTSFASFDEEILNSAHNSEVELAPSPAPSSRSIRNPGRNRDSFFYPAEALAAAALASTSSSAHASSRQHHSSLPSSARGSRGRGRDAIYWSSDRGGDRAPTTPGALSSQRSSLISGSTDWEMALTDPDADERIVSAEELTSRASTPLASGSGSTGVPPSPSGSMGSYGAGAFRWDTMSNNAEMGASLAGSVAGSIAGHGHVTTDEVTEAVVSLEGMEGVVSLEGVGEPDPALAQGLDSEPDVGETTLVQTAGPSMVRHLVVSRADQMTDNRRAQIPRSANLYNLAAFAQSTGGFSAVTAVSNPNEYLTRPETAWSDELSMSDSEHIASHSPSPFYSAESLSHFSSPSRTPRWAPAPLGAPPRASTHYRSQFHSDSARQLLEHAAQARLTPKRSMPFLNLTAARNGDPMSAVAEVSSAVDSPLSSSSNLAPATPRSSFHGHARASSEGSASFLADTQQDTLRAALRSQLAEVAPAPAELIVANEPPQASVAARPATEMAVARNRPALLPLTLSSRATSPVTGPASGRASSAAPARTSSPPSTMETRRRQAQSALDQRSLDAMQARPLANRVRSPTPAWGASAAGGRSSRASMPVPARSASHASMPVSARSASRASSTEDEADTLASRMAEWYGTGAYVFQQRHARELRRQAGLGLAGLRYHRSTEPESATSDGGPASRTGGYQSDIVGSARTDGSLSAGPLTKRYSLQQSSRPGPPTRRWSTALSKGATAAAVGGSPAGDRAPSANMFAHTMTSAARRASLLPQRARSATPAGGSGGRASVSSAGSANGGLLPLTLVQGAAPLQQALTQSLLTHSARRHRLSLSLPQTGQLSAQATAPTTSLTTLSPTPAILSESETFSTTPATTPTHSLRPASGPGPLTGHASIGSLASLSSTAPAPTASAGGKLSPINTIVPSPTPGIQTARTSAPPSAWRAPRDEPSKASPAPISANNASGKDDAETVTGSPIQSSSPGLSTPSGPSPAAALATSTEPAALGAAGQGRRTDRQVRRASLPYIPSA